MKTIKLFIKVTICILPTVFLFKYLTNCYYDFSLTAGEWSKLKIHFPKLYSLILKY